MPSALRIKELRDLNDNVMMSDGALKSVEIDGIKLKSSGNSITKSDGTTPVLSESGGNITLNANEIDINRISTDGAVIYLRKDGTTLGSISVTSAGTTYNTTGNAIEPEGLYSNGQTTRFYNNAIHSGSRICLGFVGAAGNEYHHLKLNLPSNTNKMVKFEYDGFTYSNLNVHNSLTFYTYHAQASPYQPSLVNWGETSGGIVNYYYSADNKVVIVCQTNGSYTGGFLYVQTGRSHYDHTIAIVSHSSSSATSGVY